MKPLQLYLTAGFLGSGKTTAIASAALYLQKQHIKTGVVTNDQGMQLVDAAFIKSLIIESAYVENGCFCCNYNDLEKQLQGMVNEAGVEVVFAESVGSCTDLVATVIKPLMQQYPAYNIVLSVFADAALLKAIVNNEASFINDDVRYIYKKQLEEADLMIMNKWDTLSPAEQNELMLFINNNLPVKKILYQNSTKDADIITWVNVLQSYSSPKSKESLDIDYNKYANGESLLAWFDCSLSIHTTKPVAVTVAELLMSSIADSMRRYKYTIGHLKFFLDNGEGWSKKVSFTTKNTKQDATESVSCSHLNLMINARIETTPALLEIAILQCIENVITKTSCRIVVGEQSSFKPGYPQPAHRIN